MPGQQSPPNTRYHISRDITPKDATVRGTTVKETLKSQTSVQGPQGIKSCFRTSFGLNEKNIHDSSPHIGFLAFHFQHPILDTDMSQKCPGKKH